MSLLTMGTLEAAAMPDEDFSPSTTIQSRYQADETRQGPRLVRSDEREEKRWALILAGGDGNRLRSLTHLICGDDRPKQFCRVIGRQSLLEQTRQRAARSVRPEQTIVALTRSHERFYEQDPGSPLLHRLVQPSNRGTAPPIILSLLHIMNQDPDALVAILPSDHYYSDEAAFTSSLESAFGLARTNRESIVLLGAKPRGPEMEFGWIDVGPTTGINVFRVRGFEEKPHRALAERLFESGALWNTFVMVGHASALLWMTVVSLPGLVAALDEALPRYDERGDLYVPASVYDGIPTTDYSREVLAFNAHRLLALRLRQLEWYDLGHPDRVVSVVRAQSREIPSWIYAWEGLRGMAPRPVVQS